MEQNERLVALQDRLTDEHLFRVENLDLPEFNRFSTLVTGNIVDRFIIAGHYAVTYAGENPSSNRRLMEARIQAQRNLTEPLASSTSAKITQENSDS